MGSQVGEARGAADASEGDDLFVVELAFLDKPSAVVEVDVLGEPFFACSLAASFRDRRGRIIEARVRIGNGNEGRAYNRAAPCARS
ncbi:MAG: hypothetical protein M3Q89_06730 [Verrucomicrobiota bacterium]|nr:hypothetical protein [Verrucomicrobiota bacterium]